jgi:hypothetical protein
MHIGLRVKPRLPEPIGEQKMMIVAGIADPDAFSSKIFEPLHLAFSYQSSSAIVAPTGDDAAIVALATQIEGGSRLHVGRDMDLLVFHRLSQSSFLEAERRKSMRNYFVVFSTRLVLQTFVVKKIHLMCGHENGQMKRVVTCGTDS